jgi:hypothetical protein
LVTAQHRHACGPFRFGAAMSLWPLGEEAADVPDHVLADPLDLTSFAYTDEAAASYGEDWTAVLAEAGKENRDA